MNFYFVQEKNILLLCNAIPVVMYKNGHQGDQLHKDAVKVCQNFKLIFNDYAICHRLFNISEHFNDGKIKELGKYKSKIPLKY